jgi:hypothetical protein
MQSAFAGEVSMSRNTKIALGIGGLVLFSCVLLCVAAVLVLPSLASNFAGSTTDPTKAKEVGAKIADYSLPPGYREVMGMDLFYMQMVAIGRSGQRLNGTFIMLLQTGSAANRDQMEEQMRQAFERQYSRQGGALEYVGDREVTIKGAQTKLSISEGQSSQGKIRQATGVFSGKSGIAIVMVYGSVNEWDWNVLDRFFASIR